MPTATELRELEDDELETRLDEYRREMLNLRFQLATGQLDNYSRLNQARRNVARVLTVLRDREIALAEGRDAGPVILEPVVRPPRRRAVTADDDDAIEIDAAEPAGDEVDEAEVEEVGTEVDEAGDEALATEADADEEDQA
jgi:large subunit ribosomal protein L29